MVLTLGSNPATLFYIWLFLLLTCFT